MRRALCLAAAVWLLAAADQAPPAAPAPAPSASAAAETQKLAAARALMTAMHASQNTVAMLHNLRGVLIKNIKARSSQSEEQIGELVDEVLMPEINARVGELMEALARVQASFYTLDELRQLATFYQSPLGQRVVEVTPKIGAASFAIGQEWGKTVATEAIRKHVDELRQRGVKL